LLKETRKLWENRRFIDGWPVTKWLSILNDEKSSLY
jgi:hypothetical protein